VNVDLSAGTLEVVPSLQRVGGQLRFVRPKTDDSERTVPLPEICTEALIGHLEQQQIERVDAGDDWQDQGLVFPSRIGTPKEPDNLRRSCARICTAAGLDVTRLHDYADLRVMPTSTGSRCSAGVIAACGSA